MRRCPIQIVLLAVVSLASLVAADETTPADPRGTVRSIDLPTDLIVRSKQSGAWSYPATWDTGRIPGQGSKVLVREGHRVSYDVASDDVIRSVNVAGTLAFAPDKDTRLCVGLIKVQPGEDLGEEGFSCHANVPATATDPKSARPALLVGTAEQPIAARHTAHIRLVHVKGMDARSLPAIVACGGRMEFHGVPMSRTWVKLGATVQEPKKRRSGDDPATVTLQEQVTGWRVGDRVIITSTAINNANDHGDSSFRSGAQQRGLDQYQSHTEERIIRAIDAAMLRLDQPLAHGHRGQGDYRAEVANLSRNVVVESADPAGVRGHTMFHSNSAGSISYAEFRHLGKEGELGRYPIHFHLAGDTMRGSSVVGASIWDSHNRWVTIHGTQYLIVRDCVGYQSVGHGFFLEDGTEVYNVLDRNLAVQAYRGKPLPDQALPFDKNEGAGFWWANSLNSFTRNVAVECDAYGFRFEATPKAGAVVNREKFGAPGKAFDLSLPVRQPDGKARNIDVRTLPFIRFDDNEIHSMHNYGLNLGEGVAGIGPDAGNPFVIRNLKVWLVRLGYRPATPYVLIDQAQFIHNTYGIYQPDYVGHDYRGIVWAGLDGASVRIRHMPGKPVSGDGGGKAKAPEVEVATLTPTDTLPPITVITQVEPRGEKLIVRGTTSDNGKVASVLVNGHEAKPVDADIAQWEAVLDNTAPVAKLTAHAIDSAGNKEMTAHEVTLPR